MQNWVKEYCVPCQQEINGAQQWKEHLNSTKHKGRLAKYEKEQRGEINPYILAKQ